MTEKITHPGQWHLQTQRQTCSPLGWQWGVLSALRSEMFPAAHTVVTGMTSSLSGAPAKGDKKTTTELWRISRTKGNLLMQLILESKMKALFCCLSWNLSTLQRNIQRNMCVTCSEAKEKKYWYEHFRQLHDSGTTHTEIFVQQGAGVDDDAKLWRAGRAQGIHNAVPDGKDGNNLVLEVWVVPLTLHLQPASFEQHVWTQTSNTQFFVCINIIIFNFYVKCWRAKTKKQASNINCWGTRCYLLIWKA